MWYRVICFVLASQGAMLSAEPIKKVASPMLRRQLVRTSWLQRMKQQMVRAWVRMLKQDVSMR